MAITDGHHWCASFSLQLNKKVSMEYSTDVNMRLFLNFMVVLPITRGFNQHLNSISFSVIRQNSFERHFHVARVKNMNRSSL